MTYKTPFAALTSVLLLLCARPAEAQGQLINGQNHTGAIASPGQLQNWTFPAAKGEVITLSVSEIAETTAPFWPWIRLRGPGNVQIAEAYGDLVSQLTITAPATGSYTVVVGTSTSSSNITGTGTYKLILARSPGSFVVADDGGPMTNGANHEGVLDRGDLDLWSFSAEKGDAITVTIAERAEATAPYWPWMRLYGPNGGLVGEGYHDVVARFDVVAPLSGTYTIVVATSTSSSNYTGAGSYTLRLARTPGVFEAPDEGGALSNGGNHTGVIGPGDLDLWSFHAEKGDYLSLIVSEVSETRAPFWPWLRLRGPDGSLVGEGYGDVIGATSLSAPLSGTYTVLVGTSTSSSNYSGSGTYRLVLARARASFTDPDGGGQLTNGANHAGSITLGDLDQWSFTANKGEYIALTLAALRERAAPFWPWMRVIGPDGQLLRSDSSAVASPISFSAPLTGEYRIFIATSTSNSNFIGAGDYGLRLVTIPQPFVVSDEGGPLSSTSENLGEITLGDMDPWTLRANKGETITLSIGRIAETAVPFWPWMRVFGPDGTLLRSDSNPLATQITFAAPTTGTFTVLVGTSTSNSNTGGAGTYRLTSSHSGVAVPPPAVTSTGVVNGASFQSENALAPGAVVSIFGANLASQLVIASTPVLPTTLDGVQVAINGTPAPLFFVSPTQINFQMPFLIRGDLAELVLTTPGGAAETLRLAMVPRAPAIYTLNQRGSGQGAVLFANSATLAAPAGRFGDSRPAAAGDVLTIYLNGMGAVTPAIEPGVNSCSEGNCAPDYSNLILRQTTVKPTITIGGVEVPQDNVLFSGLAPQFIGLYQINLTLPPGIPPGDEVPIVIRQGQNVSPANVTIGVE